MSVLILYPIYIVLMHSDEMDFLYCRLLDIVKNIGDSREEGSGYIVWQEVFDNGVKVIFFSISQ